MSMRPGDAGAGIGTQGQGYGHEGGDERGDRGVDQRLGMNTGTWT